MLNNSLSGFQSLYTQEPTDRLKHELVMINADIGLISLVKSKIYDAQRSFGDAVTLSRTMRGNQGDMATSFNNQAYLYFLLGDFCQAWQSYEFALAAAEQVDWKRVIVDVLNGQAELLIQVDEFEKAETALKKVEEIAQTAISEIAIGDAYLELSELEKLRGILIKQCSISARPPELIKQILNSLIIKYDWLQFIWQWDKLRLPKIL